MAFIIPNATFTASSQKYAAIDQSEPDSLDFEVLGNISHTGVLEGCAVTFVNANTVAVSSGRIVVEGVPYSVTGANVTVNTATSNQFSLIVGRVASGSVVLEAVYGNDDATNPYYPVSASTAPSVPDIDINLSTTVVFAAVYRSGSNALTAKSIVDKRVLLKNVVFDQGTTAPSVSSTAPVGSLYFSSQQATGTNSGLYVKGSAGWLPIQQNVGPQVPVGAVVGWPSSAPIPSGFLVANGATVTASAYPELAAAYGKTGSFALPNFSDHVLKGTTALNANAGTAVAGSTDTTTLTVNNLPSHTHTLNSHTHTFSHTHTLTATPDNTITTGYTNLQHYHLAAQNNVESDEYVILKRNSNPTVQQYGPINLASGGFTAGSSYIPYHTHSDATFAGQALTGEWYTGAPQSHNHTATLANYSGSTISQSSSTTSAASGNTGSTGSTTSFTNIPNAAYIVWIIRVTTGDNFPAGTSIYEEAREEVVTVQLESGAISTGTGKAYYRMPWAATLTGVKANCNNNVTSLVTLDVNEAGTSVLSTKLTIDNGESSSLTAATPAVISDANIANDALLTFDVDGGTGTGPLTVTLYFSRTT